jgi:hypothetical protein
VAVAIRTALKPPALARAAEVIPVCPSTEFDSHEKRMTKERVANATRVALNDHRPEVAQVGNVGAIAYALLEVANAIRSHSSDPRAMRLLSITDSLVDAILEGHDPEQIKKIAEAFRIERKGYDIDQHNGLQFLDGMS